MRGSYFYRSRILRPLIISIMFFVFGGYFRIIPQPSEYLLKAVFLEKFTRFIEWPDFTGVGDSKRPFVIGVLGENPFDVDLNTLYKNQCIKNQKVEIRFLTRLDELEYCHMVFISNSEVNNLQSILRIIAEKPILTVGDSDLFSGKGVIINLYVSNNRIRFEIDEKAIHRTGLRISYLLMKEAKIVNPYRETE